MNNSLQQFYEQMRRNQVYAAYIRQFKGAGGAPSITPPTSEVLITVTKTPEEGGTVTGGGKYAVGSKATIKAIPNSGYNFSQWDDGNKQSSRELDVEIGMKSEYEAQFEVVVPKHRISTSVSPEEAGVVTGGGDYNYGSIVTLSASPNDGYIFEKWNDNTPDNPRNETVTEDKEYTAIFKTSVAKPFTVNRVSYETLNDAITNCEPGSTIEMTCDYDCLSEQLIDKTITLECNNNTINVNVPSATSLRVLSGDVVVKNAKIVGESNQWIYAANTTNSLLIQNVSADIKANKIAVPMECDVTFKDCNLSVCVVAQDKTGYLNRYGSALIARYGSAVKIDHSVIDCSKSECKAGTPQMHNYEGVISEGGVISVLNNSTIIGKYATLGTSLLKTGSGEAMHTAKIYIDNSTIIGGNGWGDESSERVALVSGVDENRTVFTVTGNSVISGDVITMGIAITNSRANAYDIQDGRFDQFKSAMINNAAYPPSGFITDESKINASALRISGGKFSSKPRSTYVTDGHSCSTDPIEGYYVVS